ncbi:MAG: histidine phosphatase family protein [Halioglobus sp.]
MASIYLIRHGQASFGSANYDKLSDLGCRQAEVLGHYLRDCKIHFDAVYSGDLQRQRKTTELAIASQPQSVSHQIDPRFNEVRNDEQVEVLVPKILESNATLRSLMDKGLSESKDYQKVIEAVFNHWVSPECDATGIQSWEEYSEGVRDALSEVMQAQGSGKTVGIFASGGTIATIVAQVLGLGGAHTYAFYEPVINCSVTRLFYSGKKVSLSYYNDHSYLDLLGSQNGEQLVTYR